MVIHHLTFNMTSTFSKAQVLRHALLSRDVLSADEMELYELVHLSGVAMDPKVFK